MPKRFARYELVSELGRGGQAVVYEARDTQLDRMVALKVLMPRKKLIGDIRRFRREARAVARLNHPNVVSVYDVGTWEGRSYLAMELVRGKSLEELVAGSGMPVREAMEIASQVAEAVHCAHRQGIVHRDIKPGNILLDAGGTPKLTDFGLALDTAADTQLTQDGTIMGTATYMSPEQANGKSHEVDARSDVYSLGATLYEMLTGRPPFTAESPLILLRQISLEEPGRPSMVARAIPQDAETIVLKCLEKDPARRYQTAGELAEDIRRFLGGEAVSARRASLFYLARKGLARHKALAVGTSAVITALVIGLTAAVIQWRSAEGARVQAEQEGRIALAAKLRAEAAEQGAKDEEKRAREEEARARKALAAAEAERRKAVAAMERAEAAEARRREALAQVERILKEKGSLQEALDEALKRAQEALGSESASGGAPDAAQIAAGLAARLDDAFGEFNVLLDKREYGKARERMERLSRGAGLHDSPPAEAQGGEPLMADDIRAAMRVARALEERPVCLRRGVESLVGQEITLDTVDGARKGDVKRATTEGITLVREYRINQAVRTETRTVAWWDITIEQEDELARRGGWRPVEDDLPVVRVYVALRRREFRAAEREFARVQDHPLTGRLRDAIGQARSLSLAAVKREEAEAAARKAWKEIEKTGQLASGSAPFRITGGRPNAADQGRPSNGPDVRGAEGLVKLVAGFEEEHGRTEFAASVRDELAAIRRRASRLARATVTIDLGGGARKVGTSRGPDGADRMEFVYVMSGRFTMGSNGVDEDERPVHEVVITRGFYIGRYEVTAGQFQRLMGRRPRLFEGPDLPAVNVSWNDAVAFCRKLSERAGRTFRLPTEAEWECACRAGSAGRYCFGDDEAELGEYAWYDVNSEKRPHPVGRKLPNEWGLYDCHGNAREWCSDWYSKDYYSESPGEDPTGPARARFRVLRGGSWNFLDCSCRSANRSGGPASKGDHNSGFRAVMEP